MFTQANRQYELLAHLATTSIEGQVPYSLIYNLHHTGGVEAMDAFDGGHLLQASRWDFALASTSFSKALTAVSEVAAQSGLVELFSFSYFVSAQTLSLSHPVLFFIYIYFSSPFVLLIFL
jgi:hypothetical protein